MPRKALLLIAALNVIIQAFFGEAIAALSEYPQVEAASGILIDASDGRVLWSTNPDERRAMASTTKLMTALVALDILDLDREIRAGRSVAGVDGSSLGISIGEHYRVRELIYAMMLKSANDAAVALAESAAGNVPAFVNLMNEKAKNLGLKNTHFTNPHGLDEPGHFSSARDLAILAKAALEKPELAKIVATKSWSFQRRGRTETLRNRNLLIGSYRYATGVKTGHTKSAGYCLVASAKKGSISLISVVLGASSEESAAAMSKTVLEYGFSQYAERNLVEKGRSFKTVRLPFGRQFNLIAPLDFKAIMRKGDEVSFKVREKSSIVPPIKRGSKLGELIVYKNGAEIGSVPLAADRQVEPVTFGEWIFAKVRSFLRAIKNFGARILGRSSPLSFSTKPIEPCV